MRTIKFRAWYENQMIEVGQLDFFTDGQIHVNEELVGAKIMQSTGLVDKNGTEIYEGDILKQKRGFRENIYPVVWEAFGDCCVGGVGFDLSTSDYPFDPKDYEVIGNIHENLELLQTKV